MWGLIGPGYTLRFSFIKVGMNWYQTFRKSCGMGLEKVGIVKRCRNGCKVMESIDEELRCV
jgi:hypothetical protein